MPWGDYTSARLWGFIRTKRFMRYSVRICCAALAQKRAYLIWVPFLGKDVSNECLLHFLLLYQKLPEPHHRQCGRVARPERSKAPPAFNTRS